MKDARSISPLFEPEAKRLRSGHAEAGAQAEAPAQDRPMGPLNYNRETLLPYKPGNRFIYGKHEELPDLPTNHPAFAKVEGLVTDMANCILVTIDDCDEDDEEVNNLYHEIQTKQAINYGQDITVALIGDTGAGKSRFINNLLGEENLATVAAGGSAVTQIVTEYRHRKNLGDNNFVAEIHFKPKDIILADIAYHVRNYCRVTFPGSEEHSDEQDEENNDDLLRDLCALAEEFLLAVFGMLPGFEDQEALEDTFQAARSGNHSLMVERLHEYFERIWVSLDLEKDSTILRVSSKTAKDLNIRLKRYTDKKSRGCEALWPIVEIVRTYFDSSHLQQGLVIADCPGLTDTNTERRNAALNYVAACSAVMVASPIDRILTQDSFKRYVTDYTKLKTSSNVIVLMTKIDEMKEPPTDLSKSDQARIKALEDDLDLAETQLNNAEAAVEGSSQEERGTLRDEEALARARKVKASAALQRVRMVIRARNVRADLLKQWRRRGPMFQELRCVPVAGEFHRKHLKGIDKNDPPALGPTEDGYKTIRAMTSEMAHAGKVESLRRHCKVVLPLSINRLKLTLESTPVQRKADILAIVDDKSRNVTKPALDYKGALEATFKDCVKDAMAFKVNSTWATAVGDTVNRWQKEYKAVRTMKAFCERKGVFKPSSKDVVIDWNREILALTFTDIRGFIDNFKARLVPLRAAAKRDLRHFLDMLERELLENENFGGKELRTFWNQYALRCKNAEQAWDTVFDDICDNVEKSFQDLGGDAGKHDFQAAMNKLYANITDPNMFPKGTPKIQMRRWEHLKIGMTKGMSTPTAPLPSLVTTFKQQFDEALDDHYQTMCDIMNDPFDNIRDDLDVLFEDEDSINEENRSKVRLALPKALEKVSEYQAQIDDALDELYEAEEAYRHSKMAEMEE